MSPRRTRKRLAGALRSAVICAFVVSTSVSAHATNLLPTVQRVVLQNAVATSHATPQLVIFGSAAARCSPKLDRITLDGSDLSIELATPQTDCDAQHAQPFGLRIDPAASTGTPILPGQVYRVRVYATLAGGTTLVAFHLLDTTAPAAAPRPENGFWWSEADVETGPAAAGNGASIELQGDQLAVGLFGFGDSGAPTWYFGSTRAGGRVAHVALVQLANGDPMFAPVGGQPSAQAGPRLELEFLSPTRARAWLVRSEGGRDTQVRSLLLARTHFSNGPVSVAWSGQWVLVPDDKGPPRLFEFSDPSSQDAETFHLADSANDASLDCRLSSKDSQHPDICTLSVASIPVADFDQVGLDHLRGRGSNGAPVKLVRVPR